MTNSLTTAEVCQGMPAGFESPCGIITEPHGPHPLGTAAADTLDEDPAGVRARQVAALHALANWYAEHPDIPMPENVICSTWSYSHEGDEADRVLAVLDFARRVGATPTETWDEVKAHHTLMHMHGMAVRIHHTARLAQVSGGAGRYVR